MDRATFGHGLAWLSLAAAGGLALLLGALEIRSLDYWWHLRTGQLIVETGAVPRVDPYTFSAAGGLWIDIHWLHQVVLYGVYALGGHAGVVIGKVACVVSLAALLASIGFRRDRPEVTALAVGLALLVVAERLMPRPELPSFLFLVALLALLERHERRSDRWIFAAIAVQFAWVNVHGLFAVGIAVLAIYLMAELLRPLWLSGQSLRRRHLLQLAAVTVSSIAVSFLNPNLADGALYPLRQLDMMGRVGEWGVFGARIAELQSPIGGLHPLKAWPLTLFLSLAALSLGALALNWSRARAVDLLLWIAFFYLAMRAQRNIALFALVAAPILVRNLNEVLGLRPGPGRLQPAMSLALSLALMFLCFDVARGQYFLRFGQYRLVGLGIAEAAFPIDAAEWIAREKPSGRLCHSMRNGGYLIWRLWPEYPVLVDGRLEIFGPRRFFELDGSDSAWLERVHRQFGCGAVIVQFGLIESAELLASLQANRSWRLGHLDTTTAVFVDAATDLPAVDLAREPLFPPLDEADRGARDLLLRWSRIKFHIALRRHRDALREAEALASRHPGNVQAREAFKWLHGLVYRPPGGPQG